MAPKLAVVDVWTDLQAAGGTALGIVPDVQKLVRTRSVPNGGDNEISLVLPRLSAAWANLRENRALRLTFSDGSVEEYRIRSFEEQASDEGLTSSVAAAWPDVDLTDLGPVYRQEADGSVAFQFEALGLTIAQHLSQIILPALTAAGATWFIAGTIDPTQPVDMVYDKTTPLDACLQLAAALKVEFRLRRISNTQWGLDFLTQIGASASRLYLQSGKNLIGVRRQRDAVPMATRMSALGADDDGVQATIASAVWKVASSTSTTLRLVDPVGGPGPILEDNQLNGLYVQKYPSGSWFQVTASTLANHEITTAAPHGIVASDLVRFASGSTGQALTQLTSPSAEASYRKVHKYLNRPDIPGTVNLITNPGMRLYTTGSNAAPDGWAVTYPAGTATTRLSVNNVDKETTTGRWRSGGQSAKVVTTNDGDGIETGYATLDLIDARPFASGYAGFWLETDGAKVRVQIVLGKATVSISGTPTRSTSGGITTVSVTTSGAHGLADGDDVEVLGITGGTIADGYNGIKRVSRVTSSTIFEYQLSADPGTVSVSGATIRPVFIFKTTGNGASKTWNDLGWQNCANAGGKTKDLGVTVGKVQILQDGATGLTMYVDRAQLTVGVGEGQRAFIEGSGGVQLWQALNLEIAFRKSPSARYDGQLLDLSRLDPTSWPYDDITLGGPVDMDDPRWGIDASTRLLQVQQVLRAPEGDEAVASVVLSNRDGDLTDDVIKVARPSAPKAPVASPRILPYTVKVGGQSFAGLATADAALLQSFKDGVTPGCYVGPSNNIAEAKADLVLRGGTIRVLRVRGNNENNVTGGLVVKLYRGATLLSTITVPGNGGLDVVLSDTTLNEAIQADQKYWLWAHLETGAAGVFRSVLFWVDVVCEAPELLP